ncbi:lipocalin family protein [Steroidobacter sp.]|uniref:lipocalin family protein n=1 Tax=Steroidobacter sp. TaxID=1978227 RepID=UPI001A4C31D5|nr:lipocalin family protein [Steroidobacter sp.]MBL8266517.1 lipocalin family protein [Steroidobacter sp.]
MTKPARLLLGSALLASFVLLASCRSAPSSLPELRPLASVDLPRFMGDWYVIAHIPSFLEKGAYNAVESYRLAADGSIATTFTFNQDSPDGPLKTYHPKGIVRNAGSNSEWAMQLMWPLQADYAIVYLDQDYQQTIVARQQRDYVWIMARTPQISPADYEALSERVRKMGYQTNLLRKIPHTTQR